ncbi:MAG: hypothetical protein ACI4Q5_01655 [Porcipelethomonas sp.]
MKNTEKTYTHTLNAFEYANGPYLGIITAYDVKKEDDDDYQVIFSILVSSGEIMETFHKTFSSVLTFGREKYQNFFEKFGFFPPNYENTPVNKSGFDLRKTIGYFCLVECVSCRDEILEIDPLVYTSYDEEKDDVSFDEEDCHMYEDYEEEIELFRRKISKPVCNNPIPKELDEYKYIKESDLPYYPSYNTDEDDFDIDLDMEIEIPDFD